MNGNTNGDGSSRPVNKTTHAENGSSNNGSTINGAANSDIFVENRRKRLKEVYGREWTQDEIDDIRLRIEKANAAAEKVRAEWAML